MAFVIPAQYYGKRSLGSPWRQCHRTWRSTRIINRRKFSNSGSLSLRTYQFLDISFPINRICAQARPNNIPRVYPVTTSTSAGLGFVVSPGLVLTCQHVVDGREHVQVAGTDATILGSCVADIALLYVPSLPAGQCATEDKGADEHIAFTSSLAQGQGVLVLDPFRNSVPASVCRVSMILYRSSGAELPAIFLDTLPHVGKGSGNICHGWSGAPVICEQSNAIVGMIAHADTDASTSRTVLAVPGPVLQWFMSRFRMPLEIHNAGIQHISIGALAHLRVQKLCGRAARQAVEVLLGDSAQLPPGIGVRVVRAPSRTGLIASDVILAINNLEVDCNGFVPWHGLRVGFQAALLEIFPGSTALVKVLRRNSRQGIELVEVVAEVSSAECATLGVEVRAQHSFMLAGYGAVRLVELSIEHLEKWYGPSWQTECGIDLMRTVLGDFLEQGDGYASCCHVVVDPTLFQERSSEAEVESHENWGWSDMQGMRVVRVNGMPIRCLQDILNISIDRNSGEPLLAELHTGFIAVLPDPISISQEHQFRNC